MIRSMVLCETRFVFPLITLDTVVRLTPAISAISCSLIISLNTASAHNEAHSPHRFLPEVMLWQPLSVPPPADPHASNVHNLRQSVPRYNHILTFFVLSLFFFAHTSITCMSAIRFSDCLFTNASKNRLQQMLQPVKSL